MLINVFIAIEFALLTNFVYFLSTSFSTFYETSPSHMCFSFCSFLTLHTLKKQHDITLHSVFTQCHPEEVFPYRFVYIAWGVAVT